jgi:hypothetical protein
MRGPGGADTPVRPHGSLKAHLRTLKALHESLFAPQFHALETYGAAPAPVPSADEVIRAAEMTRAWHAVKEREVAAELAARRCAGGNPVLIDEAARTLAYHRTEQERISGELAALGARPLPQAAE